MASSDKGHEHSRRAKVAFLTKTPTTDSMDRCISVSTQSVVGTDVRVAVTDSRVAPTTDMVAPTDGQGAKTDGQGAKTDGQGAISLALGAITDGRGAKNDATPGDLSSAMSATNPPRGPAHIGQKTCNECHRIQSGWENHYRCRTCRESRLRFCAPDNVCGICNTWYSVQWRRWQLSKSEKERKDAGPCKAAGTQRTPAKACPKVSKALTAQSSGAKKRTKSSKTPEGALGVRSTAPSKTPEGALRVRNTAPSDTVFGVDPATLDLSAERILQLQQTIKLLAGCPA